MQHGKTELNGLLRANRTGLTRDPSRSAGEDTPLTISAYDGMRRVGVMFLVTSSRVAPQENLLLLSQQKFVWDRSFLMVLAAILEKWTADLMQTPSRKASRSAKLDWLRADCSISRDQDCKTAAPVLRKIERST